MDSAIPKTLPKFLWHFSKKYKFNLLGMISTAFFWGCFLSLNAYTIKTIIDRVSEAGDQPSMIYSKVAIPAIAYVCLTLSLVLVYRFYDYMVMTTFPKMKKISRCPCLTICKIIPIVIFNIILPVAFRIKLLISPKMPQRSSFI